MVKPKKHLGQHFLTDPGIAERITSLLRYGSTHTIIEIGPGKGILSSILMTQGIKELVLVEIDDESVIYLQKNFPEFEGKIIKADFLKYDISQFGNQLSIIGNFPYNISSQIFFKIIEFKDSVDEVVCMIQKEVAQRIVSPPGNKQYGILSVLLQTWFNIKLEFYVKPGSFFPPPAVQSSVIRLERNNRKTLPCDERLFVRIVKAGFNQRRKVLSNSLRSIFLLLDSVSEEFGLRRRPEQLSVDDFISLSQQLENYQKKLKVKGHEF